MRERERDCGSLYSFLQKSSVLMLLFSLWFCPWRGKDGARGKPLHQCQLPKTPKMLSLYLNTLEREEVKRTRTSSDAYRVRRTI